MLCSLVKSFTRLFSQLILLTGAIAKYLAFPINHVTLDTILTKRKVTIQPRTTQKAQTAVDENY